MMNLDPMLFESSMHETANEAVLFCKEYLEKTGYSEIAAQLAGNLPVVDDATAGIALGILIAARRRVTDEALEYVDIALSTVSRAIRGERAPLSDVA